jgi:hypothetical protein
MTTSTMKINKMAGLIGKLCRTQNCIHQTKRRELLIIEATHRDNIMQLNGRCIIRENTVNNKIK